MNQLIVRTQHTNVSDQERWASLAGGAGLVAYGLNRGGWKGWVSAAVGGMLVYRGATGHCDVYHALGVNTRTRSSGSGEHVSIPYELGTRVDHTIEVARPRAEVYNFWRRLDNLPAFMDHLESVTVLDEKRSHWVVKARIRSLEWDAEIVNEIPNELIGWRSLKGSDVDIAGSVRFEDAGQGTRVSVELQYNPPAGKVGAAVAKLLGDDPARTVETDMARFKELMETGRVSVAQSSKPQRETTPAGRTWNRDEVTRASEDSFPASDPPSWTPETL